jgi:transposase-like protein
MVYLWRAVDAKGEVLDVLVQSKRDKHAALKLMRKLLKKYGFVPDRMITDDLRSYGAAARDLGIESRHEGIVASSVFTAHYLPNGRTRELCREIGDDVNQAADLISATASIPSWNFIPLTTFGNWF